MSITEQLFCLRVNHNSSLMGKIGNVFPCVVYGNFDLAFRQAKNLSRLCIIDYEKDCYEINLEEMYDPEKFIGTIKISDKKLSHKIYTEIEVKKLIFVS